MTNPTAPRNVFFVTGYEQRNGQPGSIALTAEFDTLDQAREVVASFPKSYGLRAGSISGYQMGEWGRVTLNVKLASDGTNGGRNETGIAKIKRAIAKVRALGFEVRYGYPTGIAISNLMTRQQIDEYLAN